MLIRILVKRIEPLAGTAATEGSEPLRFDGWLELLRVVSSWSPRRRRAVRMRTLPREPLQGDQAVMYAGCIPNRQRRNTRVLEEHPDMSPDADCRSGPGDPAGPNRWHPQRGFDGEPAR